MKTQLTNIALEGTCSGDVVGGLLSWTGENLQALLFLQKGGIMPALQNIPKRPERPPVYLISQGGEIIENPTTAQITDEIDMTVMAPIRVIYELFMGDNGGDDFMSHPKGVGAVANTLFSTLERWDQLSKYL